MEQQSEFSAAPISDDQLVAWPRVAAVSSMVSFSLPTFITGIEVYQALTISDALWAMLIASILLTIVGGTMGAIGARSRMSSYLLVRIAFGNKGAGLVNMAFAISLIGWFGVNIDLFSSAVIRLAEGSFGVTLAPWPIEILAGVCMITTTIYGFKAINLLASLMVPILAILTSVMLYQAMNNLALGEFVAMEKNATLTISDGVGAVVGAIIIGTIILPDITRFSRTWQGGIHTAFWAYMIVEFAVMLVIAFAAAAMGKTEILDLMLELGIGLSAFIIVIASSWILNSLNLYSTVLSVEATFPNLKGRLVTCALGVVGVIAAFMNILDAFLVFLGFLAALFVPVAGIIIVDYLFISRERYSMTQLQNNTAVSVPAFIGWLIGAMISTLSEHIAEYSLTGITVMDAILVSGALYALLSQLPFLNTDLASASPRD